MTKRSIDKWHIKLLQSERMQDLPAGFAPAKGLAKLTWTQVEKLDAAISSLCALTARTRGEVHLTIVIRNGQPRGIATPMDVEELKPTR